MYRYNIESFDPYDAVSATFGLWVMHEEAETAISAAVAAERERLRGHFRAALEDKGITWPGEVDMLYDKCFAAPYVPDEDA